MNNYRVGDDVKFYISVDGTMDFGTIMKIDTERELLTIVTHEDIEHLIRPSFVIEVCGRTVTTEDRLDELEKEVKRLKETKADKDHTHNSEWEDIFKKRFKPFKNAPYSITMPIRL